MYGPNGADDISHYVGYAMSSDSEKYGAIDEGTYVACYINPGKKEVFLLTGPLITRDVLE